MLVILSIFTRLVGTLGIVAKLTPDVLTLVMYIVKAVNSRGVDKDALSGKIESDKEKIKNALNEPDPQKRSELLNNVFSN